MKRIFALIMIAGTLYLSSCDNNSKNTNLLVSPVMDTVSKGSYFNVSFNDLQHPNDTTEAFSITDLIINNQSVVSMITTTYQHPPDSLFYSTIQITDYKSSKISMNLSLFDSSTADTGTFRVVNNLSTFTDYTRGENKNYAITVGSTVHVVYNGADCMTGTFNLNLYYNHTSTPATGNFKIFH